jgi:hypothetical protein
MKTLTLAILLLLVSGCDDRGLPPDDTLKPVVTVEFLEASCTEAWLRLVTRNVFPPYTVTLLRDDSAVATFSSPPADTTVIDEGLAPSRTYTYRARLTSPSGLNLTGDPVQARMLDTTSHQFTWETTVLGDGGSSTFYDVAIVNDTLAYAVGEVYLRDSSGVLEVLPYNFAVWDGSTWSLRRVTVPFRGQMITVPLEGVFAHSARDSWLVGGLAIHGDGLTWTPYDVRLITGYNGLSFTKCWGSSSRDMWFAGRVGSLAHFDGSTWRRVESGTTLNIPDVWGGVNTLPGTTEVIAVASNFASNSGVKVLSLHPGSVEELPAAGVPWRMSGGWCVPGRRYYLVGDGLMTKRMVEDTSPWSNLAPGLTQYYMRGIAGVGLNDIVVVGDFGNLLHFNGVRWRSLQHETAMPGIYARVAMSHARVIAVGTDGGRAIVLHGVRR